MKHILFMLVVLICKVSPCPEECSCNETVVRCDKRGLTHVPENIPGDTTVLHLDGNNIDEIKKNVLQSLKKLKQLYLGSNPFRCDCGLKQTVEYIRTQGITLQTTDRSGHQVDTSCEKPDVLKGRSIDSLPLNSFICECQIPGQLYEGTQNQTKKGFTCQPWSKQTPHRHNYEVLGRNQENYCRNFDREEPWCFTTHSDVVWDYCDVPICENSCYEMKKSLEKCPTNKKDCRSIAKMINCHLSHMETVYNIQCTDSHMMRRAVATRMMQLGIITEETNSDCFASPCTSKEFIKTVKNPSDSILSVVSKDAFCWSLRKLINEKVAIISAANNSTCYEINKRKLLFAMQDGLKEKYGDLEFSAFDCLLSRTYEKEAKEETVQKKIETFILTNLQSGIIAIVGLLLLVGFVIVICRRLKSFRVKPLSSKMSQVTRRPTIRRTQIYHDIDETLIMHEPDEIKIDNTTSYTLLQKEADSPKIQGNEQRKEKDQTREKSNPSTLPKLPKVPEAVKQMDTMIQKTDESKVLQTENDRKGLKLEQIHGEIKKKLLEKFELTK